MPHFAKDRHRHKYFGVPKTYLVDEKWEMDSTLVILGPIFPDGHDRIWFTTVIDVGSRKILAGVAHVKEPDTAIAMTALKRAMHAHSSRSFASKPAVLQTDNHGSFRSAAMHAALCTLGIKQDFIKPRHSSENGHIERSHRTVKGMVNLPHRIFEGGHFKAFFPMETGEEVRPCEESLIQDDCIRQAAKICDRWNERRPASLEAVIDEVDYCIARYNGSKELPAKATPARMYERGDHVSVTNKEYRHVTREEVSRAFVIRDERTVQRGIGIQVKNRPYWTAGLIPGMKLIVSIPCDFDENVPASLFATIKSV